MANDVAERADLQTESPLAAVVQILVTADGGYGLVVRVKPGHQLLPFRLVRLLRECADRLANDEGVEDAPGS